MPKLKGKTTSAAKVRAAASIKVIRAFEYENGNISFSIEIDGWLTIYDMTLVAYKDKETGEEKWFISFPQHQDKKGNYWSWVYFKVLPEEQESIEEQIEQILEENEKKAK